MKFINRLIEVLLAYDLNTLADKDLLGYLSRITAVANVGVVTLAIAILAFETQPIDWTQAGGFLAKIYCAFLAVVTLWGFAEALDARSPRWERAFGGLLSLLGNAILLHGTSYPEPTVRWSILLAAATSWLIGSVLLWHTPIEPPTEPKERKKNDPK